MISVKSYTSLQILSLFDKSRFFFFVNFDPKFWSKNRHFGSFHQFDSKFVERCNFQRWSQILNSFLPKFTVSRVIGRILQKVSENQVVNILCPRVTSQGKSVTQVWGRFLYNRNFWNSNQWLKSPNGCGYRHAELDGMKILYLEFFLSFNSGRYCLFVC